MAQDTESRHLDKFVLRMPDGMRDALKKAAEENGRSMNAEIVARLEMTLETNVTSKDRLDKLVMWISRMSAENAVTALSRRLGLDPVSENDAMRDPEAESRRRKRADAFIASMPKDAGDPTKMLPPQKHRDDPEGSN